MTDHRRVLHRTPLDSRQEAEAARLLAQNGWIRRQPLWRRVLLWLALAVIWPSVLFGAFATLSGANGWMTWLVTSVIAASLYSFPIFWPGWAARFGARQLMSEAKQKRLQDLPPRHPNKSM